MKSQNALQNIAKPKEHFFYISIIFDIESLIQ